MVTIPMGISSHTLLHESWSSGSREIVQGVTHVEIVSPDMGMMCSQVIFGEVVYKIFLTLVQMKSELFLHNFTCNPKVSHFHRS